MTKLARIVQKIFGVNSDSQGITVFGTAQNIIQGITPTYSKDVKSIQNANFEMGWGSAVPDNYAPFREDKNAVEYVLSRQLAYLFETGTAEYDEETNYCLGAKCCEIDNTGKRTIYQSVVADNLGNELSNTDYWTKVVEITSAGILTCFNALYAPTAITGTNNTQVATTAFVADALLRGLLPTGVILPFGGDASDIPDGYLLCNGGAVSRTTYSKLFSVVGTAYGAGDGNTTFNLPNTTDRVLQGNGRGFLNAGLPNIAGVVGSNRGAYFSSWTGPFYNTGNVSWYGDNIHGSVPNGFGFNASRANSIYGASETVQPPACLTNFIIKY